ncbi:MAG: SMC-Scp complex subunit ScpB [Planctomycetales bacterium]
MESEFAELPAGEATVENVDRAVSEDDLEAAYRRALAAVEAAEQEFGSALADLANDGANDEASAGSAAAAAKPRIVETAIGSTGSADAASGERRVDPRRIVEAALFVGGVPLTTRKLCALLRDEFDPDFVEGLIDDLNAQYAGGNRPYEVRFGEGGFRLCLRDEHERLRNRVFGHVPRDVRLSQAALEILALVAYRQPLTREEIEAVGRNDPAGILRQLVRRELVGIERSDESPQEVRYRTTPRFLQLFGLGSLVELPRAEDLEFK